MIQLTPNVYVQLNTHGCNCGFVVTSDGVVSHDSPMLREKAEAWGEEIAKHGPLRYIICGEPHSDHIRGNHYLGSTMIGHEGTHKEISKMSFEMYENIMTKYFPNSPIDKNYRYRTPDITIKDKTTIYLGNHTFEILVMPGHTPWNICTYVPEEKVIFTSDTIADDVPVLHDAMPLEWLENLKFMQTLDIDKVVGGHGQVMDKDRIQKFIDEIHLWLDPVEDAIKKGWSLEEAKKNITMEKEYPGLADQFPWMPDIVSENVAQIYNSLINKDK